MGESLLSGPSGNVPPEMIKMHTHTTLITHTQLFSALIVNWEEEKIKKKKKKKSFHRYNPRGCFIFSHRKRMEREEEEGEKERIKKKEKLKSTAILATTAWLPVG
jgi:hypothetical protein